MEHGAGRWTALKRASAAVCFVTAAILIAILLLARRHSPSSSEAPAAAELPKTFAKVPDFELVDSLGEKKTLADLRGKVWIAGFVFTRCHSTCPMVSGVMARLRSELPSEVQMVTITVDPAHDRPRVLADYAKSIKADTNRWWFLTGDKEEVYSLIEKGFLLPVRENPSAKEPGEEIVIHSTRLAVVDQQGRLRGFFDAADPSSISLLPRKVRQLLKEGS